MNCSIRIHQSEDMQYQVNSDSNPVNCVQCSLYCIVCTIHIYNSFCFVSTSVDCTVFRFVNHSSAMWFMSVCHYIHYALTWHNPIYASYHSMHQRYSRNSTTRDRDWDRDFEIWVLRHIETETQVTRTTRLVWTRDLWIGRLRSNQISKRIGR